jgi:hypothetical protein
MLGGFRMACSIDSPQRLWERSERFKPALTEMRSGPCVVKPGRPNQHAVIDDIGKFLGNDADMMSNGDLATPAMPLMKCSVAQRIPAVPEHSDILGDHGLGVFSASSAAAAMPERGFT